MAKPVKAATEQRARGAGRRWKPGESGNPKGRPKGTSPVAALRAQIGEAVPGILEAMVAKAQDGDAAAARLLLERVLPPVKADELPTPIDLNGGTLTDKAEAVVQALAGGDISPSQAATLLSAIGSLAKAREVDELEQRVAALEAAKGSSNGNA
jgi:hypothetical protein